MILSLSQVINSFENERSSFLKPAVQQWARKVSCSSCMGFSRIGRRVVERVTGIACSVIDGALPEGKR